MSAVSGASWSVNLDYSHDLAFALAIRDTFGFTDPLGLPHIDPPLTFAVGQDSREVAEIERQWRAWWDLAMASPGHEAHVALTLAGPLGEVVRGISAEILRWSSDRKRELARSGRPVPGRPRTRLADALREHEQATGVRLDGFQLKIIALPVAGSIFVPVEAGLIAASIRLISDRSSYFGKIISHLTQSPT
ncbi:MULTISPECIES: hypothetical protein [Kitasatospora]|uniref:Uncharacterized protein n=1 Tax=Kitasatospora cystarginea TaxID=58350 RepID=A0ABN3EJH6_9ACTN